MGEPIEILNQSGSVGDILKYISLSTFGLIIGGLYKFYSYTKTQTIKEENSKNRVLNLEKQVISNKLAVDTLKDKTDTEFRMIMDKIDKVAQIQTAKTEELKNLLIELFRDK